MLYRATVNRVRVDGENRFRGSRGVNPFLISVTTLMVVLFFFNIYSNIPEIDTKKRPEISIPERVLSSSTNENEYKRPLLPASVWATRVLPHKPQLNISHLLTKNETTKVEKLCGKFVYSTLRRAASAGDMAEQVFVSTGDIDNMWIRDSVVQMSIYLNQIHENPWLRPLIEGVIRRNSFNIIQDPYANAYSHSWQNPKDMELKDQVIGRGGFVGTRNYELDSGAYFLCHLYDYYQVKGFYRPEVLLMEPIVFDAVMLMIDTWIVEQRHDEISPYRYFELPGEGKGTPTIYTGMTWTGFRPSDDATKYGYLIPANIHAAAALERVLILNERVWKSAELDSKAEKLLREIESGIKTYGIVKTDAGKEIYAYEVDGKGGVLSEFDDANVPSLLSIPLLGWTGYDRKVYKSTRESILSPSNPFYFKGEFLQGIGSPHTPRNSVWPMSLVIQGLTEDGDDQEAKMAFQMKQLLTTATYDSMHESVHVDRIQRFTRAWFEWANALFVIYAETTMGVKCGTIGNALVQKEAIFQADVKRAKDAPLLFHTNPYKNDHRVPRFYQEVVAWVKYE